MILLGIDIGLSGAVASIDAAGRAHVVDLPTVPAGKSRRICGRALILLLRQLVPANEACTVVFEDVRARPQGNKGAHGNTMHSQASLVGSRAAIETVLDITGWQRKAVQPASWKRAFGLIGKEKDAARQVALQLFPGLADELRLKKSHNRADSLLLAQYGRRFA